MTPTMSQLIEEMKADPHEVGGESIGSKEMGVRSGGEMGVRTVGGMETQTKGEAETGTKRTIVEEARILS